MGRSMLTEWLIMAMAWGSAAIASVAFLISMTAWAMGRWEWLSNVRGLFGLGSKDDN